jgi:FtsZ-interacting cell division protein ZipA
MTLRDGLFLIGAVALVYIVARGFWRPPKVKHPSERGGSSELSPPMSF